MVEVRISYDQLMEMWEAIKDSFGKRPPADNGRRYTNKQEILKVTGIPGNLYCELMHYLKQYGKVTRSGTYWLLEELVNIPSFYNKYIQKNLKEQSLAGAFFTEHQLRKIDEVTTIKRDEIKRGRFESLSKQYHKGK
jgi:hypothetical protein